MSVFWLYKEGPGHTSLDLTVPATAKSWKLLAVHINLAGGENPWIIDLVYDPGSPGPASGIYQRFIASGDPSVSGGLSNQIGAAIQATPGFLSGSPTMYSLPDIKMPPSQVGDSAPQSQIRLLRVPVPGKNPFESWNAIFLIEEEEEIVLRFGRL